MQHFDIHRSEFICCSVLHLFNLYHADQSKVVGYM